jgi:hypothetical protein
VKLVLAAIAGALLLAAAYVAWIVWPIRLTRA